MDFLIVRPTTIQLDAHSTNQDLNTLIDFLCDSTDTSYSVQRKVLNLNVGLEKLVGKILEADGNWQWDDTNYTNLPRGTGTLVEGQESYSFAAEYLNIQSVEVLIDSSPDVWHKLNPIESLDLDGLSPEEYFGQESNGDPIKGLPEYYDKLGDSIFLYPAPAATSVTLTAGLRVWFQRTADLFTTSDTTQEPGIPSPYHSLLAYWAAIPYCMKYKPERVALYKKEWDNGIKDMLKFFGKREKDKRHVMTNKKIRYI